MRILTILLISVLSLPVYSYNNANIEDSRQIATHLKASYEGDANCATMESEEYIEYDDERYT